MKILVFLLAFQFLPLAAGAYEPGALGQIPAPGAAVIVPEVPAAQAVEKEVPLVLGDPTVPYFPFEEFCLGGAVRFNAGGKMHMAKLGFLKGHYDDYVKTYKTRRVMFIGYVPAADRPQDCMPITIDIQNSPVKVDNYTLEDGRTIIFDATFGGLTVTVKNEKDGSSAEVAGFTSKDMLDTWAEYAGKYAFEFNGRKIYAVPQAFAGDYLDGIPFGYVLSEDRPLYHATGLPLDYVELSKSALWDGTAAYRPVGYSIPLGLAIEKRQEVGWLFREIESSELTDALDQEAEDAATQIR